jgi:ParB-like chromosome segregation protein Spo0J
VSIGPERQRPALKPLHPEESLSRAKLVVFEKLSSEFLVKSLAAGQEHCLKARPDGTILDGHHRVYVLQRRGVDVDALPREVLERKMD